MFVSPFVCDPAAEETTGQGNEKEGASLFALSPLPTSRPARGSLPGGRRLTTGQGLEAAKAEPEELAAGRMLRRGPQGAPAGSGGGDHGADNRDCSLPAASFRRRRLARRPGYMRSTAGPGIEFLSPAVGSQYCVLGGEGNQGFHNLESSAETCGHWQGPKVGTSVPKSTEDPPVISCLGLTRISVRGSSPCSEIQLQAGTRLPDRLTGPCGPADTGCWQEFSSMDCTETLGPSQDAACGKGTREPQAASSLTPSAVSRNSCSLRNNLQAPAAPPGPQDVFASSFSFIRQSLGSAGERGEAEGCLPFREPESSHQSPQEMETKASSLDTPHEYSPCLSQPFDLPVPGGSAVQAVESSSRPEHVIFSSMDKDHDCSCLPASLMADCHGEGHSGSVNALQWTALLSKWEPALQDCLSSNQRKLEVTLLRLKLQKLQDKAVQDDDYDKAEILQRRLEDLEQENSCLRFQLPSRQLALSSFLKHLATQAQVAWRQAIQQAGSGDDTQAMCGAEPSQLEPKARENLCLSLTRRDWLLQEKQQLQKEIEALQARMSVLEAKDQQLQQEIAEQEQQLQWQGCDLTALMRHLSPSQLQDIGMALQDTLASARQVPFCVEPPETIKSLQERIKSLNLSLKEITAKVCMSERLCSTLRRKMSDIEIQLPALLEAKMLAISGNHFCTAKELMEEIQSLAMERQVLEGVLNKLLMLSSRNVQTLGSVKEDYTRLKRDLQHREAAYEVSVKENIVKYMEILEDKLSSCMCPLLGKVWEADLEACRMLLQSLQLQEARGSLPLENEGQMDDLEEATSTVAAAIPPSSCSEEEKKIPLQALQEWKTQSPYPHCKGGEQKEECYILSAELEQKCEAISKKLLYLEDELHTAIYSHDEGLIHILFIS
ncbi:disrupted in schizophrenia 1 protein isoform X1 [Ochotona princeps]|uniref:disrupted in schizophrenia 1 protein isoform X1 n=1 Tax=Ochotona princeps TaxID=9978 RepID=UPI0027149F41|nr:disrupted in schizophrenia 1 protein isoform X1 [Ochotona princeps]